MPDFAGVHVVSLMKDRSRLVSGKLWMNGGKYLMVETYEMHENNSYKTAHKIFVNDPHSRWLSAGLSSTFDHIGSFPVDFQVLIFDFIGSTIIH